MKSVQFMSLLKTHNDLCFSGAACSSCLDAGGEYAGELQQLRTTLV